MLKPSEMYSRVPIYRLQVKRTLKSQDSILTNQLEILAKVTGGGYPNLRIQFMRPNIPKTKNDVILKR